jgi:DNA-binding NarL/FixJ family response regulator
LSNTDVITEEILVDKPIHLLLVDSPTLHRRSLAAVLNRRRSLHVVAEAATGREAIAHVRALQPDVAVVEPQVPGGGSSLIADLCQEGPSCAVLVLTRSNDENEVRQALQAGARGYLDMDREIEDLVRAIERVNAGELVVAQLAANTVLKELSGDPSSGARPGGLTTRELEVLRLVAQGRTNPQIAQELYITEHTAKAHLAKILNKLELNNRVQLATYAMQQGLTPLPDATPQLAS